ncbi:peptidylprolyl isomerase [soil metagenome]
MLQVNDSKFFAPDFVRAVADQEERIKMLRAQYGQYADLYLQMMGMPTDPKLLAINSLTRKALLNGVAIQMPLFVTDELAQARLKDPMFIYQELSDYAPFFTWDHSLGSINPLALTEYHRRVGITTADFTAEVIKAAQREELKKLVEHSVYVPEFELKEQFAQTFLGRKFSVATISNEQIVNRVKKEAVTNEQLQSYYKSASSQGKRYYVPEKRFVKIYSFGPTGYGINVSNDEIERYYQNNKAQYVEKPAQVQVRRILLSLPIGSQETDVYKKAEKIRAEAVANPEKFTALAKEHSGDSKTANQGGLVPFFSKGTHDRSFEKASFTLAKEGDVSAVIKTNEGYEIVQLVGKKPQSFKPMAQVSADIKESLALKKFNEQFATDVRSALSKADPKAAIAQLAKDKNGIDEGFKDVNADDSVLSKTAFRLRKNDSSYYLDKNQIAKYADKTRGYVATLVDIKESFLPALEIQKAQVTQDYYADKAAKELTSIASGVVKQGLTPALKAEIKFEKTGMIRHSADYKGDETEKQALTKKGYDLGKMFQIENIGGLAAYQNNGNAYIIRLDELAPFDAKLYEQKKSELQKSLIQQKKSLTMAGFVASLYRNAKINKNESLIRNEQ